jgi:3-oxoadipate enol-lactonase
MFHRIGDRSIHAVSFGSGSSTLVAIAGSIGNWEIWQQPLEILSRRWRVIALDHDGVGESKVPTDEVDYERLVQTLLAVLDRYQLQSCVLAGDSNNVAVAIDAVLRQPERFRGLALVNGTAWGYDRPGTRQFVDALQSDFERTVAAFAKHCLPEDESGHLRQWLRDIIGRTGPQACCRLIECYYGVDLRDRLSQLDLPTVVIHGALDRLHPDARADAEQLAAAIPGARLELLERAGHVPTLSHPERVAELLEELLVTTCR